MCRKALSKASGNTVSPHWTCAGSRCCRRAPSVSQSPDCVSAGDPVTSWLCQCRGPPDVVTWREPFRARPSRGSSGSAWGRDAEGRTPACPARADSFRGSPPCPFPWECPPLLRGPHLPELRDPRGRTGVAGECARVPGSSLGREGFVGKRWTQDRETLANFTPCGNSAKTPTKRAHSRFPEEVNSSSFSPLRAAKSTRGSSLLCQLGRRQLFRSGDISFNLWPAITPWAQGAPLCPLPTPQRCRQMPAAPHATADTPLCTRSAASRSVPQSPRATLPGRDSFPAPPWPARARCPLCAPRPGHCPGTRRGDSG